MRATSFFTYELQVTTYCTSYKLNLSYKLRVPIYCKSWYLSTTPAIHFFGRAFKKLSNPSELFMNKVFQHWIIIKFKISLHFYDLFLQYEVFLASCYWAINFVNVCSNCKLYATKLWHSKWEVGFWMQQEFYWCNYKSSSTNSIYDKWNHIRTIIVPFSTYYIRNSSLYARIRKVLLELL